MRVPMGNSCTVSYAHPEILQSNYYVRTPAHNLILENLKAGVTVTHPFGDGTLDRAELCFSVGVLRLLCTTHCVCEYERVDTSFVCTQN